MFNRSRLYMEVFSLEVRKILSYRVDFWASFIGTVFAELGLAYFLWTAIFQFRGVTTIGGYTLESMMFYYLLVPVVTNITHAQTMHFISEEIYMGTLNRYLVYPLSFFAYKYVAHLAYSFISVLQLVAAVALYLAWFGMPAGLNVTFGSLAAGVVTCFLGATLYFLVASCLEMVAFWADNVWSLLVMLRLSGRLLGGAMIPLALFPDWAQDVLRVIPLYHYMAFPVEVSLGQISFGTWLSHVVVGCAWIVLFYVVACKAWRCGNLKYTGVGI